jgi:methionyl aminopeptidase
MELIVLKSPEEIEKMSVAGRVVAMVLKTVSDAARVGVTTMELDQLAEQVIRENGGTPAFKGYQPHFVTAGPFPGTLCTSLNSEVVHGIPDDRPLAEGDLLSVDTGAELDGYYGDAAVSMIVGKKNREAKRLIDVTSKCLKAAIRHCKPDAHLSDISHAIQRVAEAAGYSVVRRFVGHGIGSEMHEDPPVPNYGEPGKGPVLKPGMVLAIEPMVNAGGYEVDSSPDRWQVYTSDGHLSAHFEHTVAVTDKGPRVLTTLDSGERLEI